MNDIIYTLDAKHKDGTINELYKRTISKSLTIDSRFRKDYYNSLSSNYNYNLPTPITNVMELEIDQLVIAQSWYSISKELGNHFFWNGTTKITIPDGNYNAKTMQTILKNKGLDIIIDVDESTGVGTNKTIITGGNELFFNKNLNGQIDNTPLQLKLGWILGFRYGHYKTKNNQIVSEGQFDGYGPKYLYLAIDDFNNTTLNDHISLLSSSIINKKIIARYSVFSTSNSLNRQNNNYFNNIIYFNRTYSGPVNINKLNIQLLDEYGRIINLNNMDYSFVLKYKTLYSR